MEKRKGISKRNRFEVFKRDLFVCQYCGNTPPKVTLEVDHIIPVSKGGKDSVGNLITSCFDCNRGKSNIELTQIPAPLKFNIEQIKERELQIKKYRELLSKIDNRILSEINEVDLAYQEYFPRYCLTEKFKENSVKRFIEEIGVNEVIKAMKKACYTVKERDDSIKYFCGICWNIIKKKGYE